MFKNFKISVFAASFLLVFACQINVSAQEKAKIVSGDYDTLILGINPGGELTGYFNESTGVDDEGNSRFNCTFFIYGAKETGGVYKIKTWFPESPEEVVEGELKYKKSLGNHGVNIKLKGEHGGCWNVAPTLKDEEGLDFTLNSKGNWEGIRIISSKRVYLFKSVDAGAPQKIFVDKNDIVKVFQTNGDWAEIRYASPNGRNAYGWMKISDFYALEPK